MNNNNNMTKNDYVPDIIVDILSKLPSKSVWRFRIVCKTWYSLISDPVFTNLHSKRAPQSPNKILYRAPNSKSFQLLDYEISSSFNNCCLSGSINFRGNKYYTLVGSSCGLVCLDTDYLGNNFTIWNPLTKEFRKLPKLSMMSVNKPYFHGLGYDSVANDFKLVISKDRIRYNIFSLKENSWKTIICPLATEYYHPDAIEDRSHSIMYWNSLAIVLNGIFYWFVALANNDSEIIVALDVRNETFQKLQLPQVLVPLDLPWKIASLLEHNGCLCISLLEHNGSSEIWMTKEYDNWVPLLTIKNSPEFIVFGLPVLCISTRNYEVIFHTDPKFSCFGREEEYKLNESSHTYPYLYRSVLYVETLVSPNVKNRLQLTG